MTRWPTGCGFFAVRIRLKPVEMADYSAITRTGPEYVLIADQNGKMHASVMCIERNPFVTTMRGTDLRVGGQIQTAVVALRVQTTTPLRYEADGLHHDQSPAFLSCLKLATSYLVQQAVAKLALTAVDYPPMQDPASFNLEAVKRKVEEMIKTRPGQ